MTHQCTVCCKFRPKFGIGFTVKFQWPKNHNSNYFFSGMVNLRLYSYYSHAMCLCWFIHSNWLCLIGIVCSRVLGSEKILNVMLPKTKSLHQSRFARFAVRDLLRLRKKIVCEIIRSPNISILSSSLKVTTFAAKLYLLHDKHSLSAKNVYLK